MENQLNFLITQYLTSRMNGMYSPVAQFIPDLTIKLFRERVEKIDFIPRETVKLNNNAKLALVSCIFRGELLNNLLDNLDCFEVTIGKHMLVHDSDEISVEPGIGKFGYPQWLSDDLNRVTMAIQQKISFFKEQLERDAKYLAINLGALKKNHGQKEVLRSITHGRCTLVISKETRHFESEDYYNSDRLLAALDMVATASGDLYTVCYDVYWDGKLAHNTAMEGYMTKSGISPLKACTKSIYRMAKEAMFCARIKLQSKGDVKTAEEKQSDKLFACLNLGTNH